MSSAVSQFSEWGLIGLVYLQKFEGQEKNSHYYSERLPSESLGAAE